MSRSYSGGGETLSETYRGIVSPGSYDAAYPALATDLNGGNLTVVFQDTSSGNRPRIVEWIE